MAIDRFTKEQFEDALPRDKKSGLPLWKYAGCLDGEQVYTMDVIVKGEQTPKVVIEIRSSVRPDGHSADVAKDSIRAWLNFFDQDTKQWVPMGSKAVRWVDRRKGWQERMIKMLRTLYRWRLDAGDCPVCGRPKMIFIVTKDGINHGRVFCKCAQHNGFRFLDADPAGTVQPGAFKKLAGNAKGAGK